MDLYKETGYEVHLEPIPKADNPSELPMVGSECTTCFDGNEDQLAQSAQPAPQLVKILQVSLRRLDSWAWFGYTRFL